MKMRMMIVTLSAVLVVGIAWAGGPADSMKPVFEQYEALRAELAADGGNVDATAAKLERSANAAATKAAGEVKKELVALSAAAKDLAGAENLAVARKSFGEVSRHLVAVVAAAPELGDERFVFACPMAPGYKKWVQTKTKVENPYMGSKMLACGSASDWSK